MPVNDHSFSVVEESLPHDLTLTEYRRARRPRRTGLRERMLPRRRRLGGAAPPPPPRRAAA